MDKQSRYNKTYYRENRDGILAKRKERYHSESGVREAIVEKSKEYRDKQRADNFIDRRGRRRGPLPPRELELKNGRLVKAYSSGNLAETLGISISTLRKWISVDKIPISPYELPSGRWWTQRMVNALVRARDALDGGVKNYQFNELVQKNWPWDEMSG